MDRELKKEEKRAAINLQKDKGKKETRRPGWSPRERLRTLDSQGLFATKEKDYEGKAQTQQRGEKGGFG